MAKDIFKKRIYAFPVNYNTVDVPGGFVERPTSRIVLIPPNQKNAMDKYILVTGAT